MQHNDYWRRDGRRKAGRQEIKKGKPTHLKMSAAQGRCSINVP
jgi:hypothetical protein